MVVINWDYVLLLFLFFAFKVLLIVRDKRYINIVKCII